eukprot:3883797-Pleurochrysis_carterae.AAC.1
MDKLVAPTAASQSSSKSVQQEDGIPISDEEILQGSLSLALLNRERAVESQPISDDGDGNDIAKKLREMQRLQSQLVAILQAEYFCDDLELPADAFGWSEGALRNFFESGGEA